MAVIFLFSAITKAIDPIGVGLKVKEYLLAIDPWHLVNIHNYLSIPIALILILFEFFLGVRLLLGIKPRSTTIYTFLFVSLMTFVTIFIFVTGDIKECGCFGDIIHLSNGETLIKNIVFLPIAFWLMYDAYLIKPVWNYQMMDFNRLLLFIGFCVFIYCNYRYLPMIDTRPYAIGTNLRTEILKESRVYNELLNKEFRYKYVKNGVVKSFSVDSLPRKDSGWVYQSIDSTSLIQSRNLLKYDFHPMNIKTNTDISENILTQDKPYIIVFSKYIQDINDSEDKFLYKLSTVMEKYNYPQYFIYWNGGSNFDGNFNYLYSNTIGATATVDLTTLNTITRQSPIIMIIRNGVIIDKIAGPNFPKLSSITKFVSELRTRPIANMPKERALILFIALIMAFGGYVRYELLILSKVLRVKSKNNKINKIHK